jgi:hypothetical protein
MVGWRLPEPNIDITENKLIIVSTRHGADEESQIWYNRCYMLDNREDAQFYIL